MYIVTEGELSGEDFQKVNFVNWISEDYNGQLKRVKNIKTHCQFYRILIPYKTCIKVKVLIGSTNLLM